MMDHAAGERRKIGPKARRVFLMALVVLVKIAGVGILAMMNTGGSEERRWLTASQSNRQRILDSDGRSHDLDPSSFPSDVPSTSPPLSPSDNIPSSQEPKQLTAVVQPFSPAQDKILLMGTTQIMEESRTLDIDLPPSTQPKDLLVLFLHRTDDLLPWRIPTWKRVAWCFKGNNHYNCATGCHQILQGNFGEHGERYCGEFVHPGRSGEPPEVGDETTDGRDLAQVVFIKEATMDDIIDASHIRVDFGGSQRHPSWAILVTLRGVNTTHPVRDWASTGADMSNSSIFPNVTGRVDDTILLSQSFDDQVTCPNVHKFPSSTEWMQSQATPNCLGFFHNPNNTQMLGYIIHDMDATGFLWGGTLQSNVSKNDHHNGHIWKTEGPGIGGNPWGPPVKDLMISLTIRPTSKDGSSR